VTDSIRLRTSALLLASACLLPPAFADTIGVQKRPPPALTRAELRVCMDRDDALKERSAALERVKQQQDAAIVVLTTAAKDLAESLRTLDASDHAAVDAHNQRAKQHDVAVEAHNKRADAYNAAVVSLNADSAEMLAACSTRPYMQSDKQAILAERKKKRANDDPVPPDAQPAVNERPVNGRGTRI
jgi:hypothetical protein